MYPISIPNNILATHALAGGAWVLYNVPTPGATPSLLWPRFKLMPAAPTRAKRNGTKQTFYLSWNPREDRFAKNSDHTRLQAQEPALHAELTLFMSLNYDAAWLAANYSADEIEAEERRLIDARVARGRRSRKT